MSIEATTKDSRTKPAPNARSKAEFDWLNLHRRLEESRAALTAESSIPARRRSERFFARVPGCWRRVAKRRQRLLTCCWKLWSLSWGLSTTALNLSHIREIHPLSEFTPLPCTPAFVLGLVNVRGQILSIINIKKLFDLPEKGLTDLNKVIVVHADHMELGILADAILGVRSITPEEFHPALPTLTGIRAEYLKGITKDPLVVIDMEKILSDEKILVNEVVNAAP